jgi:hypothetical protein
VSFIHSAPFPVKQSFRLIPFQFGPSLRAEMPDVHLLEGATYTLYGILTRVPRSKTYFAFDIERILLHFLFVRFFQLEVERPSRCF